MNGGSLVAESTGVPTEPQPLSNQAYCLPNVLPRGGLDEIIEIINWREMVLKLSAEIWSVDTRALFYRNFC